MIYFSRPQPQLTQFGPSIQIDDFISEKECEDLIALMPFEKLETAMVSEIGVKNTSIRSTKVCALEYLESNQWIFQKLEAAITQLNNDVYSFDIEGISEAVQLMQYSLGDHYGYHMDSGNLQFSRRKLSFSVQLTNPNDYHGGELEFFRNGSGTKNRGALILFPSYFYHRVTPVSRGTRRALVGWVDGPPYK